ncbi:hypothetical protein H1R20_g14383, partial [Candolleomyces eurysporus]
MVNIQPSEGYGSNNHADWVSGLSTSQRTASGFQLAQQHINTRGYDGNNPRAVYNMASSNGLSTEGVLEGQGYGWDDTTYRVDGYGCDGLDVEGVSCSSVSVVGLEALKGDFGAQSMPVYDAYPSDVPAAQSQPATNESTSPLQSSKHNSPYHPLHVTQSTENFERTR